MSFCLDFLAYPKQSTDSIQFPLNYQRHFQRTRTKKFLWNRKELPIAKATLSKKNGVQGIRIPELRLHYKAIVNNTVWYRHKTNINHWNRIESPEINLQYISKIQTAYRVFLLTKFCGCWFLQPRFFNLTDPLISRYADPAGDFGKCGNRLCCCLSDLFFSPPSWTPPHYCQVWIYEYSAKDHNRNF